MKIYRLNSHAFGTWNNVPFGYSDSYLYLSIKILGRSHFMVNKYQCEDNSTTVKKNKKLALGGSWVIKKISPN